MSRRVTIDLTQTIRHTITIDLDDYDKSVEDAIDSEDAYFLSDFTDDPQVCDSETDWDFG